MFFFFFNNNHPDKTIRVNEEVSHFKDRAKILSLEARLLVLRLLQLRDFENRNITSVKFNGKELPTLESLKGIDLSFLSIHDILNYTSSIGYDFSCRMSENTRVTSKVNIEINGNKYGIRCFDHTERPLINHSTRDKFEKLCKRACVPIEELDDAVDFYWQCREAGLFNEDCIYTTPLNPFIEKKDVLRKLLTYIAFHSYDITKEYDDPHFELETLDGYIDYRNPIDENTWDVLDENTFFDKVWTHLRFSFRADRGMPSNGTIAPTDESIKKWTREWTNRKGEKVYKGALHIRICQYDTAIDDTPVEELFAIKYQEEIADVKVNQGEKDEYLLKLFLVECRKKCLPIPLGDNVEIVQSVENSKREEIAYPNTIMNWEEIRPGLLVYVCKQINAGKASAYDKSDVYINGVGVSVKSKRGGNPSIINQTTREKILRVMNAIHSPIEPLDHIVDRYWALRQHGGREDVYGIGPHNPFTTDEQGNSTISVVKPLLNYFSFKGTGTRDSESPAELILIMNLPNDPSTWIYYTEENFIDSMWKNLVFSIRSKGMPRIITDEMRPWIRESEGKKKGTLNVRVKE